MTPLIAKGAPIAVVAPSGAYDPAKLEAGLAIARSEGFDLRLFHGMLSPVRYLAADDRTRLAQLIEALTSPDYAAVWLVRGGYGATRLIADLPRDRIDDRPVIGFSDATALFCGLPARSRCIHGPMLHSLASTNADARAHLFRLLAGEPTAPLSGEAWVPGEAAGPLIGGNLAMLASLCGTPFMPTLRGHIVVLEDIGEAPYRVDRMLQQLRLAGALDGVAGLAFGEFENCPPPAGSAWSLRDVLLDHAARLGVPVVGNLPIGHGANNFAFPWGASARLRGAQLSWEARRSAG